MMNNLLIYICVTRPQWVKWDEELSASNQQHVTTWYPTTLQMIFKIFSAFGNLQEKNFHFWMCLQMRNNRRICSPIYLMTTLLILLHDLITKLCATYRPYINHVSPPDGEQSKFFSDFCAGKQPHWIVWLIGQESGKLLWWGLEKMADMLQATYKKRASLHTYIGISNKNYWTVSARSIW